VGDDVGSFYRHLSCPVSSNQSSHSWFVIGQDASHDGVNGEWVKDEGAIAVDGFLVSSHERQLMQYSTIGFSESLRQEKNGFITRLIESPTNKVYGHLFEFGPVMIFKIKGWHGESLTIVRVFSKEIMW
jgi:hypothetical protein